MSSRLHKHSSVSATLHLFVTLFNFFTARFSHAHHWIIFPTRSHRLSPFRRPTRRAYEGSVQEVHRNSPR